MVKKNNNFFFDVVKGITIFFLFFVPYSDKISCTTAINVNIFEAVLEAYYNDEKKKNGVEGVFLMLFLTYITKKSLNENTKNNLFKIWTLIYLHWNIIFCINQDYGYQSALTHNLPAFITTLTKKFTTFEDYLFYWKSVRGCSLIVHLIYKIIDLVGTKGTEEFEIAFFLVIMLKKIFKISN